MSVPAPSLHLRLKSTRPSRTEQACLRRTQRGYACLPWRLRCSVGVDLVTAACRSGVIGAFPTANAGCVEELDHWLLTMDHDATASGHQSAPHCPNLIVRQWRFQEDLASLVRHKVEMVITSVGSPAASVGPLHDLGCLVFADIASLNHAEKAIKAGADGVVLDIEVTVTAEEAELQMMTRSKLTRSRGRANYRPQLSNGVDNPAGEHLGRRAAGNRICRNRRWRRRPQLYVPRGGPLGFKFRRRLQGRQGV